LPYDELNGGGYLRETLEILKDFVNPTNLKEFIEKIEIFITKVPIKND
jgi:hypothetical protein